MLEYGRRKDLMHKRQYLEMCIHDIDSYESLSTYLYIHMYLRMYVFIYSLLNVHTALERAVTVAASRKTFR